MNFDYELCVPYLLACTLSKRGEKGSFCSRLIPESEEKHNKSSLLRKTLLFMQKFHALRTRALSAIGPKVFYRVPTPKGIMRWRQGKGFFTVVISFSLGCIVTLLFCSSNDIGKENVRTPDTSDSVAKTSEEAADEVIVKDEPQAVTTTAAPKPTLPPYPPFVTNGKPAIITPSTCDENAFLIIIVTTTSRNFEARKAIRSSWAKRISEVKRTSSDLSENSFQVFFVVGSDEDNDERIAKEATRYEDILRGNFLDTFVQNEQHTVKTLLGLKWATSVCNPRYILKVNSDSFVNVHQTLQWLYSMKSDKAMFSTHEENVYAGFCHGGASGQAKVVRNPQSPFFIPENMWAEPLLPSYVSGIGIILSRDVAEKMVQSSREITLVHIDDVFLGVLAKHHNIHCTDVGSHFDTAYTTMLTECEDLSFFVLGSVPAKDMFYLSQNVDNLKDICKQGNDAREQKPGVEDQAF